MSECSVCQPNVGVMHACELLSLKNIHFAFEQKR